MKYTLTTHRKAIAMIELIFAIVVMGIVMLSAPMMLTTATKSSEVAFQQESIAILATHANSLLTYPWDEQNTEKITGPGRLSILAASSDGVSSLTRGTMIIPSMLRTKATPAVSASSTFSDGGEKDDVDDFNNFTNRLQITTYSGSTTTDENEYMDISININTQIAYGPDAATGTPPFSTCSSSTGCAFSKPFNTSLAAGITTTNVKLIRTTLTSSRVPNKNITMKAFMCNIGVTKPRSNVY